MRAPHEVARAEDRCGRIGWLQPQANTVSGVPGTTRRTCASGTHPLPEAGFSRARRRAAVATIPVSSGETWGHRSHTTLAS